MDIPISGPSGPTARFDLEQADGARPASPRLLVLPLVPGDDVVMAEAGEQAGDDARLDPIGEVILYAQSRGWRVAAREGGVRLYCAYTERDGCQVGINATPLDMATHAKQIRRAVDRCPHSMEGTG